MPFVIDNDLCVACGSCIGNCPNRAIVRTGEQVVITDMCSDCGTCIHYCTMGAIGKGKDKTDFNTEILARALKEKLAEDLMMVEELIEPYNEELYLEGIQTPVFFGSALYNFGVKEVLDMITTHAPGPKTRPARLKPYDVSAEATEIEPTHKKFLLGVVTKPKFKWYQKYLLKLFH